jgi:hydrogenase maturation factor
LEGEEPLDRDQSQGTPATAERLAAGKIPPRLLEDIVFRRTGARRKEVLLSAAIGEDTAALDLGGELLVTTTDPVTGAGDKAGWLAVKVALNDLGAAGAEPVAILLTLLLPVGSEAGLLEGIMDDVHRACLEENVSVAGGHTEATPGLDRPIISVTALGKTRNRRILSASGAREGDDVLVTKWAGMEGTSILVRDFRAAFRDVLTETEIKEAEDLLWRVSVTQDGRIAAENGASGSHDATEGGVLGAVYEMCEASGLGVVVDADRIPVLPVTRKVAAFTGIDPLRLVSSGCLVVSTRDGSSLRKVYNKCGLPAEVVGRMIRGGRTVKRSGETLLLEPPQSDELWRARERLTSSGKR